MIRFIVSLVLLAAAVGLFAFGNRKKTSPPTRRYDSRQGTDIEVPGETTGVNLRPYALIPLILGIFFLGAACVRQVGPSEVGVPVALGKAGDPLGPGIHFVAPWTKVKKISTQTEVYVMVSKPEGGQTDADDTVEVRGSDQATGSVNARLNYRVPRENATEIFKEFGTSYSLRVVRPAARNCLADAATKRPLADSAAAKRSEFEGDARACLTEALEEDGFKLEDLRVAEISLPEAVQESINEKSASLQRVSAAQNNAEAARVDAKGRADSQQIIQCGATLQKDDDGKEVLVPKEGDECENRLTNDYLRYLYIQAIEKNAEAPNNTTFVVPSPDDLQALINTSPGTSSGG